MNKLFGLISSFLMLVSCITTKNQDTNTKVYGTINTEYIDTKVNPEEDFFLFANGTWINNTEIPNTESRWGSFNELDLSNKKKLTNILEEASKNPGQKGSQNQILGDYYTSFINMERRNSLGISGIEAELNRIQEMNRKDFLVEVISEHHKDGINSVFGFGIGQDLKNVTRNIAYLSQGGLGLPNKDYYIDEKKKELLNEYELHIARCFQLIGKTEIQAKEIAQHVLEFEKKFDLIVIDGGHSYSTVKKDFENSLNLIDFTILIFFLTLLLSLNLIFIKLPS